MDNGAEWETRNGIVKDDWWLLRTKETESTSYGVSDAKAADFVIDRLLIFTGVGDVFKDPGSTLKCHRRGRWHSSDKCKWLVPSICRPCQAIFPLGVMRYADKEGRSRHALFFFVSLLIIEGR